MNRKYQLLLMGVLVLLCGAVMAQEKKREVIITIVLNPKKEDTAHITTWQYTTRNTSRYDNIFKEEVRDIALHPGLNRISQTLVEKFQYASIKFSNKSHLQTSFTKVLLEPGDSIHLVQQKDTVIVTGRGAAKWVYSRLDDPGPFGKIANAPVFSLLYQPDTSLFRKSLRYQQELFQYKKRLLDSLSNGISVEAQQLLTLDAIGYMGIEQYEQGSFYFFQTDTAISRLIMTVYADSLLHKPVMTLEGVSDSLLIYSDTYAEYLLRRIGAQRRYEVGQQWIKNNYQNLVALLNTNTIMDTYLVIVREYAGAVREKLLAMAVLEVLRGAQQDTIDYVLKNVATHLSIPYFIHLVKGFNPYFLSGAPLSFELQDSSGRNIRLSDLKGKVVFLDMWFSGCGACQMVAQAMPSLELALKDRNDVVLVSVSVDKDRETWLQSIREGATPTATYRFAGRHFSGNHELYLYTGGKGTDHPFIQEHVVGGYPTLMLISKTGRLVGFNPIRPDKGRVEYTKKAILAALEAE